MFRSWTLVVTRTSLEAASTELAKIQQKNGSKKPSTWTMTKDELVEMTCKTLGMTPAKAHEETLTTLRERIKKVRQKTKMLVDPLAKIPLRLERIKLEDLKEEIVSRKSVDDAMHVALATVSNARMIVSWNFKHIVNFQKIPLYNAVNKLKGYDSIEIYSPQEVIEYEDENV